MVRTRRAFNQAWVVAVLAAAWPPGPLQAQECSGVRWDRVGVIAGSYVIFEAALLGFRGGDWWSGENSGFSLGFHGSPAKQQDRLLHGSFGHEVAHHGALPWRWACFDRPTAAWLAAGLALALQIPKEIGDGFQAGDGFDVPDMVAASAGAALSALYETYPSTQAWVFKFNYWPSYELRNKVGAEPDLESDYAGQRVYLAYNPGNIERFPLPGWWPRWLGLAVGHGVDYWIMQPPSHEWYLAADLNFRSLPVRASWWPAVADVLDHVHVPLPGIRIRHGGVAVGLF